MKKILKPALALALLAGTCMSAQAEVAVIVNAAETATPSKADVGRIYLGRSKSLKAFDQSGWNPTKAKFYADVTSKDEGQLKGYWSGLVFTGKGQPLEEVGDEASVVKRVSAEAGTIGYVDSSAVTSGVKVLFTLP